MTELPQAKLCFFDFSREELAKVLAEEFALPAYRADQLFDWVYRKGCRDFQKMSNVSGPLRDSLAERFCFLEPKQADRKISSDGTRKYLFEVGPGELVEAVMIKQPKRMTLCISSQVGCAMACKFCRTGTMGLKRHLKTSEIIGQVLGVIEDAKNFDDGFSNVVFMGMGEPLHNFDNVVRAVKILRDHLGFGVAGRKITVSTVGLVPAIGKFFESGAGASLAVSLNATTDEVRGEIMPVNLRYSIEELLGAIRVIPDAPRRSVTIEYVMLSGVNDTDADLKRLPKILHGLPVKVNLIPYNENAGLGFRSPPRERVHSWQKTLTGKGIQTFVRWSKGSDISAACGQLATASAQRKKAA